MLSALLNKTERLGQESESVQVEMLGRVCQAVLFDSSSATKGAALMDNSIAVAAIVQALNGPTGEANLKVVCIVLLCMLAESKVHAVRLVQEHPTLLPQLLNQLSMCELGGKLHLWLLKLLSALVLWNAKACVQLSGVVDVVLTGVQTSKLSDEMLVLALGMVNQLLVHSDQHVKLVMGNDKLLGSLLSKSNKTSELAQVLFWDLVNVLLKVDGHERALVDNHPEILSALVNRLGQTKPYNSLELLIKLTGDTSNAQLLVSQHADELFPLLTGKFTRGNLNQAISLIYNLSCPAANQGACKASSVLVGALIKAMEDFKKHALLALVNLFGADEDGDNEFHIDESAIGVVLAMLESSLGRHSKWKLNQPLLALRHLCRSERTCHLIWQRHSNKPLVCLLSGLDQAVATGQFEAAENAISALAHFSFLGEPREWIIQTSRKRLERAKAGLMEEDAKFASARLACHRLLLYLTPRPTPQAGKLNIAISFHASHADVAKQVCEMLPAEVCAKLSSCSMDGEQGGMAVVILASNAYRESIHCRLECEIARQCGSKMFALLMEPGSERNGWLGVDPVCVYDLQDMRRLVDAIETELCPKPTVTTSPVAKKSRPCVPQNQLEVRAWLSTTRGGEAIANALVREDLAAADCLEMLATEPTESLKEILGLDTKQAFTLKVALKRLVSS